MKIRFLQDTYIRSAPTREAEPPLGTVFKGTVLDVESDATAGEPVNNIDQWYRDKNGWFYWGGRTEAAEPPPTEPQATTVGGGILWPKPPDAVTPVEATGEIPPGETRPAPSLEQLLEWERQARSSPLLAVPGEQPRALPPQPAPEPTASQEIPIGRGMPTPPAETVGTREMPAERTAPPPSPPTVSSEPSLWKTPDARKLNWGVQSYRIARDWWQERELTGRGVRIALLSTGIAPDHPDLAGALDGQFNFIAPNEPMTDVHGIGVQAAVLALGRGHSVFGVAPEARLLAARIGAMDQNLSPEGLAQGLRWATDAGADIIAMLVDFTTLAHEQLETIQGEVQRAVEAGVFLLAPVGNSFDRKPESRYPAALDGVFSVGACDQYGKRSAFSAKSYKLDILAPGEGLLTSTPAGQAVYNLKSTALAAAFTAGFVALTLQALRAKNGETWPGQVFDLLRQTAIPFKPFNKGEDVECGHGLLNPIEVLKQLNL